MPRNPNAVLATGFSQTLLRYTEAELKKADTDKDGRLTRTESQKLPSQLRDNLLPELSAARRTPYISSLMFEEKWKIDEFVRERDYNRDGFIDVTEGHGWRHFGVGFDDDLESYSRAAHGQANSTDLWAVQNLKP